MPLAASNIPSQQAGYACNIISVVNENTNETTGAGVAGRYEIHQFNGNWVLKTWDADSYETNSGEINEIPTRNAKDFPVKLIFKPTLQKINPVQLEIINGSTDRTHTWIKLGTGCPTIQVKFPDGWNPNPQEETFSPTSETVVPFTPLGEEVWETVEGRETPDLAWGDVNNDGFLDLAVADSRPHLYLNQNGQLSELPSWTGEEAHSNAIELADFNEDGLLILRLEMRVQTRSI